MRKYVTGIDKYFRSAALAGAGVVAATPSYAITVTGGIDPGTGLKAAIAWGLASLAGAAIVGITTVKGVHAVHDGRSLGPAVGACLGGTALCFGSAYALTAFGVL